MSSGRRRGGSCALVRSGGRSRQALALAALVAAAAILSRAEAQAPSGASVAADLAPSDAVVRQSMADLSPDAQLASGKQAVAGIEHAARSIQRDLQAARDDRDVVRVLCLTDKLNQVDVALRAAQDRSIALGAAVKRNDAERSRHDYTVLVVLSERVRVVADEATQCVGEETGFVGEAEISVSIEPNLPDAQTAFSLDTSFVPAPPNISSPIE